MPMVSLCTPTSTPSKVPVDCGAACCLSVRVVRVDSVQREFCTDCCNPSVLDHVLPGPRQACLTVCSAAAVLVTASLGVLKKGSITFQPPLPQRKLDVIQRMGFGVLNKVACVNVPTSCDPVPAPELQYLIMVPCDALLPVATGICICHTGGASVPTSVLAKRYGHVRAYCGDH